MNYHAIGALLVGVSGLVLVAGALPPNRRFGIRTPSTLSTPLLWYKAHRRLGLVLASAAMVVGALQVWPGSTALVGFSFLFFFVMVAAILRIWRSAA